MKADSRSPRVGVWWLLWAAGVLLALPAPTGAQEGRVAPPEIDEALPEARAPAPPAERGDSADGLTDSGLGVESVITSVQRTEQHSNQELDESYVIEFGDTFDWIRLESGEWIKGRLKRMRKGKLEFDSEKLEALNIDFEDVTQAHSPHPDTYLFSDRVSVIGKGIITRDKVIVQTRSGTKIFPRDELQSIIEGGRREMDWWWMKLRFGLTLNRGNTNQLTYDLLFNTRREDDLTILDLSYNANFGRTDGVQNVSRHLGELTFKVFVSKRWFVSPIFGQLFNDRFQNIHFRATPAAGLGVHLVDKPHAVWDFQTGIGYQFLRYGDGSSIPGDNPRSDVFIPLYTYADFDITPGVELTLRWLTNLVLTTVGATNHTANANLSVELTSILDLDVAFLFLRTEEPGPPADPTDPPIDKNDYQLVVGISLELG